VLPARFRQLAWWALATQIGIVVTGAAVRLTGSGLGCTDWPGCRSDRFVPEWGFHHWVEFGNRLLTFVVSAAAGAAAIGAHWRRPRRRSLIGLSWGLVVGIVAQALIGAVLVIFELDPRLTVLHFIVSLLLIADAVLLLHIGSGDGARAGPSLFGRDGPAPGLALLDRALFAALALAVVAVVGSGTVVTGSGPHGGDERADRFGFLLRTVAQVHAATMWVFVAVLVLVAVRVLRPGAAGLESLRPNVIGLLAVTAAQAVLGYLQYAMGVPAGLVALHVLGSALVWSFTVAAVLKAAPWQPERARPVPVHPAGAHARPVLSKG
jgi:cytochrome c oxidase assembly protein subunit 15